MPEFRVLDLGEPPFDVAGARRPTRTAPPDDREPAILIALPPGAYTAIVSGAGGTSGVALVQVYDPN